MSSDLRFRDMIAAQQGLRGYVKGGSNTLSQRAGSRRAFQLQRSECGCRGEADDGFTFTFTF
jgi:hypothetical protein